MLLLLLLMMFCVNVLVLDSIVFEIVLEFDAYYTKWDNMQKLDWLWWIVSIHFLWSSRNIEKITRCCRLYGIFGHRIQSTRSNVSRRDRKPIEFLRSRHYRRAREDEGKTVYLWPTVLVPLLQNIILCAWFLTKHVIGSQSTTTDSIGALHTWVMHWIHELYIYTLLELKHQSTNDDKTTDNAVIDAVDERNSLCSVMSN